MTIIDEQQEFAFHIACLITHIYARGYKVTCGDFYRDERVHGAYGVKGSYSSAKSNHKLRLAADLNLFKDGKYLTRDADHKQFGDYWEALHEHNRWGGRFGDGNHYERVQGGWRED